jgi:hypothetical protein
LAKLLRGKIFQLTLQAFEVFSLELLRISHFKLRIEHFERNFHIQKPYFYVQHAWKDTKWELVCHVFGRVECNVSKQRRFVSDFYAVKV